MEKKQIIFHSLLYSGILLFLYFIGSGVVLSPVFGDINVIDEGQFGAWLNHLSRGEKLYKDIYAAYGPLFIYPLYWLSMVTEPSIYLIRVVYIVISTFIAILISDGVLKKLSIHPVIRIFTLITLLIVPAFGMRQGSGLFAILLLYIALEKQKLIWSILAGSAMVFSFLISPDIGVFTFVVSLAMVCFHLLTTKQIQTLIKQLGIFLFSGVCVFLLFYLWATTGNWFWDYLYSVYSDFTIYSGIALPNGQNFPNILSLLPTSLNILEWIKFFLSREMLLYWLFFLYLITFLYLIIKLIRRNVDAIDLLVFGITLFGFFLSTILIGRSGHFSFTVPPAFILVAYYLNNLLRILRSSVNSFEKIVAGSIILLLVLFNIRIISLYRPNFSKILQLPTAVTSDKNNPSRVGPIFITPEQASGFHKIHQFISKNSYTNENVYFFSNDAMLYFLVDRGNPTRYDLPEVANTREKRLEVLSDLRSDKTRLIIYNTKSWDVDGVSNRTRLPEVDDYIEKNYTKTKLDEYIIYTIKK
jgi:hypothetical protein